METGYFRSTDSIGEEGGLNSRDERVSSLVSLVSEVQGV
jgi:hypothetical protein